MLKTLQIGLEWFGDRPGGLDRYYYDCCRYLPATDIKIAGLLAGSDRVLQDSNGQVRAFALPTDSLPQRWLKMRTTFEQQLKENRYDLIVSHFALYTFPILDRIPNIPLINHFHGPWALESDVEKSNLIAIWLKKQIEKAV